MKELVEELKTVHAAALGERLEEIETFEKLLTLLKGGEAELPAVVDWSDDTPQSIVLKSVNDDQICFYNPAQRPDSPPKTVVVEDGPLRTVVGSGLESLSIEDFRQLFNDAKLVCLAPVS